MNRFNPLRTVVSAACAVSAVCGLAMTAGAQPCGGLVGLWTFEGSGQGGVNDSSGLGNHGVAFGSPAYVPGISGLGLALDGIDDFVEIADSPSLNPASAMSISAWWYSTEFTGSGSDPIVDKGASCHCSPYYQYQIGVAGSRYRPSSSFSFICSANGAPVGAGTSSNFYTIGRWYHIVGTYDGSTASMFVNGTLVSQYPVSGSIVSYGKPVRFGHFNNLSQFYLPGVIDEIRIYDRALTSDEAELLYASPSGRPVVLPSITTVCPGGLATFRVSHLQAPGASYQWYKNGHLIPSEVSPTITVAGTELASYSCVVTTDCGSQESTQASVVVCAADFNCDGFLDGFDYDDFVSCFEGDQCPSGRNADFNNDGFPDGFDYDDFVTAFEAGCL